MNVVFAAFLGFVAGSITGAFMYKKVKRKINDYIRETLLPEYLKEHNIDADGSTEEKSEEMAKQFDAMMSYGGDL